MRLLDCADPVLKPHILQMLWTGKWSYLRMFHLAECVQQMDIAPRTVMSFGSGAGEHEACLALLLPDSLVRGIDNDRDMISYCAQKFADQPNLGFVCTDVMDHDERYDFIYTIECLEHIEDYRSCIERLCNLTGRIMVLVPNLLQRYNNPEGRKLMWRQHHHIGFSVDQLESDLNKNGFRKVYGKGVYWEHITCKVRLLFEHLLANYPDMVRHDEQLLLAFKQLYELDAIAGQPPHRSAEPQGTLVYAVRQSL